MAGRVRQKLIALLALLPLFTAIVFGTAFDSRSIEPAAIGRTIAKQQSVSNVAWRILSREVRMARLRQNGVQVSEFQSASQAAASRRGSKFTETQSPQQAQSLAFRSARALGDAGRYGMVAPNARRCGCFISASRIGC